ncbi:glutathione S-transferase family protein [Puniceibacterium sp. IMCC21224]|uniref:glutathione S-transferase family protein n=1 Tax=Puniceibacterium sp. IMCC21224 TaxID=1618204 RepID=UPI00064D9BB1|nr:glutathione S-transferase N-terminal domain-containing protein [Puniceibacterium sp. IMCC21224]KMK65928.1 glutathione S-transferase [Puniceibacterium sp. IMCC21224]
MTYELSGPGAQGRAILRTTPTSPFGRKVRIAAQVLRLDHQIEERPANTLDQTDNLRQQNPLGKMPCLLANGLTMYDSRVILEYLDAVAGGGKLIPTAGADRFQCLTLANLADGVADAGLLMVYEGRFRNQDQTSDRWLDHQRGKVARGLDALQAAPPDPRHTDVASISLACMLSYLDWRRPVAWRDTWAGLGAWLDSFADAEPAYNATRISE